LRTNKPYITYIEKSSALFGYTAKKYYTLIARSMLYISLRSPKLRYIFFRSHTALQGCLATYKKYPRIHRLLQEKSVYVYPSLASFATPPILERFKKPPITKFFFNSSSFILKGGYQLVRAFTELSETYKNIHLTLLTKESTIDKTSLQIIRSNSHITLIEPNFNPEELFEQFYCTHHCFVYPTYSDSFAMVINEAIAAHMPIITSDFFAIPERVHEGVNGFLFPSPYKNYTADFVIQEEHFGDNPLILQQIYEDSIAGNLDHIQKFLYEKMLLFVSDPSMLYRLAQGTQKVYNDILLTNQQNIIKYFNSSTST
jgi:glycosyltransferase involved in cell wall biosynthesis